MIVNVNTPQGSQIKVLMVYDDHDLQWEFILLEDTHFFGYFLPAGYRSDGASVPHWARICINQLGKQFLAAWAHDWEYDNRIGTRAESDWRFYKNMRSLGVNWFKASLMYLAVRIGGGRWWKN